MERKFWKLLLPVSNETEVDYLILEDDTDGSTGGFFAYYLSSTNPEDCFSDEWYESFEIAQSVATEYGISIDDWQVMKSEEISRFVLWYHGRS
ncbi:MAG: hypothetical protein ACRYFX_15660 [Janthinobacterium lividum]